MTKTDKEKANKEIRQTAKEKGVYFWQIAVELGVSEATITRALRVELSNEKKNEILNAINRIANKKTPM